MATLRARVYVLPLLPLLLLLLLPPEWGEATSNVQAPTLRIGAFNIKMFGRAKMSNAVVAQQIKEIVEQYDVLLIQEIRDNSGDSVRQLMGMLPSHYDVGMSDPLGRSRNKERYAYVYRSDKVYALGLFQLQDGRFERPPIVFHLTAQRSPANKALGLIGVHTKPSDAVAEIGHLRGVIATVEQTLGPQAELVVLGDLNAACSYANLGARQQAGDYLTTATNIYEWLIGENDDTATSDTNSCAYDRIIIRRSLLPRVTPGSAKVFNFKQWLQLTQPQTLDISDHFPVEMEVEF